MKKIFLRIDNNRSSDTFSKSLNAMMPDGYKNLPIGIEIYDRDGYLAEINDQVAYKFF